MALTPGGSTNQFGRIAVALTTVTTLANALPEGNTRDQLHGLARTLVDAFAGRTAMEPAVARWREGVATLKAARQAGLRRDLDSDLVDELDVSVERILVPELRCVGFEV